MGFRRRTVLRALALATTSFRGPGVGKRGLVERSLNVPRVSGTRFAAPAFGRCVLQRPLATRISSVAHPCRGRRRGLALHRRGRYGRPDLCHGGGHVEVTMLLEIYVCVPKHTLDLKHIRFLVAVRFE
jgi:hypothetical protein